VSANVYTNIMPCHRNNILHYALPEIYFAIIPNLAHGKLASFSSSRAAVWRDVELQILRISSSTAVDAVLLAQALLHLFLLRQVRRSTANCFRPRCRCKGDALLRNSINLPDGRRNASRLCKTAPRRHSVSLTLSQALRRAIPGRL